MRGGRAPVHSPVSFDLTVTSLFLPLLAGRSVELVPEERGDRGAGRGARRGRLRAGQAHARAPGRPAAAAAARADCGLRERLRHRRRGAVGRAARLLASPRSGPAPDQRLRARPRRWWGAAVYEVPASMPLAGPVSIGRPIANTRHPDPGRAAGAGAGRGAGRALHRRRGCLPRVSRPAGPDGREVRAGSVRQRAESGSTARATSRAAWPDGNGRVPGPPGPPGQDPRLPHRAGRDRGGAGRAARSPRGGRGGARGSCRASGGWSPMWPATVCADALRAVAARAAAGATWCRPPS